jgi:hypothetical protein
VVEFEFQSVTDVRRFALSWVTWFEPPGDTLRPDVLDGTIVSNERRQSLLLVNHVRIGTHAL